jgi:hypothetical protein
MHSIVKAVRRHYAMLQHRPSQDRVAVDTVVRDKAGNELHRCTCHVKETTRGMRSANHTRAINLHWSMYPEAHTVSVATRV